MKNRLALVWMMLCVPTLAWAECSTYSNFNFNTNWPAHSGAFFEGVVAKVEIKKMGLNVDFPEYTVYLESYKDSEEQLHNCEKFYIGGLFSNQPLTEFEASAVKMVTMALALNQFLEGRITGRVGSPYYFEKSESILSLRRR